MKNIAVFASGTGTNAKKIIGHFMASKLAKVALVVCNKPGAGVLGIAENFEVPVLMIEKDRFFNGDGYLPVLLEHNIEFIVLAGFLWKIPVSLISAYPDKIVNIHPALLPRYGGKGMYGAKVHEAVIAAADRESGITIHLVNEVYDEGRILFQATCPVTASDNADTLAEKIHRLEHAHYPVVIEKLLGGQQPFPESKSRTK